jgi:S1-C subfamily serine protease
VLGVGFIDVPPQQAASMNVASPQGAFVLDVTPGSIASKAGITAGDVILEFGSMPIAKAEALQEAVAKVQPGQHVAVKIWRGAPSTLDIQF